MNEEVCHAAMRNNEEKKGKKRAKEEASKTDYIHVRARRGQATDSHSLAERARREKISERMRLLQSIVPGCDKITGNAQILEEIINYVQALQNQVELLIGKLATQSPMLNYFELELDTNSLPSEKLCRIEPQFSSMLHSSCIPLMPVAEPSVIPRHHNKKPDFFGQDNGIALWEINDQRLKFENQEDQFNLSSFF